MRRGGLRGRRKLLPNGEVAGPRFLRFGEEDSEGEERRDPRSASLRAGFAALRMTVWKRAPERTRFPFDYASLGCARDRQDRRDRRGRLRSRSTGTATAGRPGIPPMNAEGRGWRGCFASKVAVSQLRR